MFFKALTIHELAAALGAARQAGLRRVVIGGGANLLFDDAGFRGLVIRNAASGLVQAEEDDRLIEADSGTPLEEVVEFAAARGLSGLAFLAGIPGTVGGAVYGNAGAYRKAVGDILEYVLLLGTDGREEAGRSRRAGIRLPAFGVESSAGHHPQGGVPSVVRPGSGNPGRNGRAPGLAGP